MCSAPKLIIFRVVLVFFRYGLYKVLTHRHRHTTEYIISRTVD